MTKKKRKEQPPTEKTLVLTGGRDRESMLVCSMKKINKLGKDHGGTTSRPTFERADEGSDQKI